MNSTNQFTATDMRKSRLAAALVGIFFIVAAVTSVIGLLLYDSLLNRPNYLLEGFQNKTQIVTGALMELLLVLSAVGTTVGLFPYLRKYNESMALGYLCFRFMEAVLITVGVVAMLSLLSLSQEFATSSNPNLAAYQTSGTILLAIHDWTFKLGPNFMLGVNTLLYSFLFYKSRLIPRFIACMGLTGASLILLAALLEMFGVILQISTWGVVLALPVAAYEMTLATWLIIRGFNREVLTTGGSVKSAKSELVSVA